MPPSNSSNPAPASPNPQYDFILRDPKTPKKKFSLPLPKLPRPIGLILLGLGGILLALIAISVISGGRVGNYQPLVDVTARAQEIKRVSTLAQQQTNDADLRTLAVTVQVSLTSDQQQLVTYLASQNVKIDPASQTSHQNKNTDSQLQAADQTNNLNQFYKDYLKTNLGGYQTALTTALGSADSRAKLILDSGYNSSQTILDAL